MRRRNLGLLALAPLMCHVRGGMVMAEEATADAPVRTLSETLIAVMQRGPELGFAGRVAALQPVVAASFDMPLMARVALGGAWGGIEANRRDEIIASFEAYSVAQYARSFASYSGERIEVGATRDRPSGDKIVQTKLFPADGEAVALDYLLRNDGSRWRIIDVYLDGAISQLAVRRSELSGVLKQKGVDGLLAALDAKAAEVPR